MRIDPSLVTLRPGNSGQYLNIGYDNQEVGHLRFHLDGRIAESWAIRYEDRPLVELIARCGLALPRSPTRP
jgi:hypothetical protein